MDAAPVLKKEDVKKLRKPNNIFPIFTTLDNEFFRWWCIFLRPFVNLTGRELDVVSSFLKQRWELSKDISNPSILDAMVMSEETKKKVIEECNITLPHFYVVMSSLRKSKIITNNALNPKIIPNIRPDDNGCFQLLILFKDFQGQS